MSIRVLFISLLVLPGIIGFSQSNRDSLIRVINSASEDSLKVNALNELAFSLRIANPDSALLIARESKKLATDLGYKKGIASACLRMGMANTSLGNYFEALQHLFESKSGFERIGMISGMAASVNAIGRVYNGMQDLDKALIYYKQAIQLYKDINDRDLQSRIENNVGYIYKIKGEYDSAQHYLGLSLRQALKVGDSTYMYYPIYNIGSVYLKQHQLDSARKYLTWSWRIAIKDRDNYLASLALIDMGSMHLILNQTDAALEHFTEAYNLANESGLKSEMAEAAQNLAVTYEQLKDTNRAYFFLKEYKQLSDTLFNKENTRRIALLEAEYKYQQAQREQELSRQLVEAERLNELKNVKWIRNSFIVGFVLMLIISYLLYKNFSRKQKANAMLKELNAQIQEQALQLKASHDEIVAINSNLEMAVEERTRQLQLQSEKLKQYIHSNSHVVRAPVARILALIEMYKTDRGKKVDIQYVNDHIYHSAKELDGVLREINDLLNEVNEAS